MITIIILHMLKEEEEEETIDEVINLQLEVNCC